MIRVRGIVYFKLFIRAVSADDAEEIPSVCFRCFYC